MKDDYFCSTFETWNIFYSVETKLLSFYLGKSMTLPNVSYVDNTTTRNITTFLKGASNYFINMLSVKHLLGLNKNIL